MRQILPGTAEPVRWPRRSSRSTQRHLAKLAGTLRRPGWIDLVAIAAVVMLVFSAVAADRDRTPIERSATGPGFQLAASSPETGTAKDASDTTMYRGNAARTGEMPGPGPDGVPALAWTKHVEEGPSRNPVAADGRLFYPAISMQTQTFDLQAADLATGEDLWTAPIDVDSRSVPAVADGMVYVNTSTGLKALDASTGDVAWTFPAGDSNAFISPVVQDGVVYVAGSDRSLSALDAGDGTRLWSVPLPGTVPSENYPGSFTHVAVSGELVFGRSAEGTVSAFDIHDGKAVWTATLEGSAEETFLVSESVVAVTAVDYSQTEGQRPVRLHALDATTGDPVWSPIELTSTATLAAADGVLFVADSLETTGTLSAYDIRTGESIWTQEMGGSLRSPVYVDGQLYVLSNGDGTVQRIDAATGVANWSVYLGAHGEPIVVDGLLIASGYETLYAVAGEDERGTPPPAEEPVDLSGLPPCEPPRTPPAEPLTGKPAATIDVESRPLDDSEASGPPTTIDGRPVETTDWLYILGANIPTGEPATPAQIEWVEETIAAMAACSQRPGSESQIAGFFSDDFFRRGIVTPGSGDPLTWSIQPDEEQLEQLEVFVLEDGRVAASAVSEPGAGTFLIFVEDDGALLVDEVYLISPEYPVSA